MIKRSEADFSSSKKILTYEVILTIAINKGSSQIQKRLDASKKGWEYPFSKLNSIFLHPQTNRRYQGLDASKESETELRISWSSQSQEEGKMMQVDSLGKIFPMKC